MFDASLIEPYREDWVVWNLRRREEQARLLAEYEAEHGVVTQDEMDAVRRD